MAAAIRVDALSKRFGPLQVLREVSCAVAPADVVCIVGPSCSGKSTPMRRAAVPTEHHTPARRALARGRNLHAVCDDDRALVPALEDCSHAAVIRDGCARADWAR